MPGAGIQPSDLGPAELVDAGGSAVEDVGLLGGGEPGLGRDLDAPNQFSRVWLPGQPRRPLHVVITGDLTGIAAESPVAKLHHR